MKCIEVEEIDNCKDYSKLDGSCRKCLSGYQLKSDKCEQIETEINNASVLDAKKTAITSIIFIVHLILII